MRRRGLFELRKIKIRSNILSPYGHERVLREIHKKSDEKLIRELAQKDYAKKILVAAYTEKKNIQQFLKEYHPNKIQDIYKKISPSRQNLITPYVMPDKDFIEQWGQAEYPVKYEPEEDSGIYTENNEAVRSKSEKILADKSRQLESPTITKSHCILKATA